MEKNYLEYISKLLGDSSEMMPEPTTIEPDIRSDGNIKAVAFDIYGTIVISASGDIDESVISTANLKTALDVSGITLSPSLHESQSVLIQMLENFRKDIITFHEEKRSAGNPFPEVDILKIWESIIYEFQSRGHLTLNGPLCIKCFTFVFEVLSNNINAMPGMKEVIFELASRSFPLGIVSNAQFYTPVILNYFLNGKMTEDGDIHPFDHDLSVFSYRHMRSKPDSYLFDILKKAFFDKYGLVPSEVLFVGNDMFRDIYPAQRTGFKTALFAGDNRSLRLRKDRAEISGISPDFVITDLKQILTIIS
jgi:putative hydrolase of the HAD superfamily